MKSRYQAREEIVTESSFLGSVPFLSTLDPSFSRDINIARAWVQLSARALLAFRCEVIPRLSAFYRVSSISASCYSRTKLPSNRLSLAFVRSVAGLCFFPCRTCVPLTKFDSCQTLKERSNLWSGEFSKFLERKRILRGSDGTIEQVDRNGDDKRELLEASNKTYSLIYRFPMYFVFLSKVHYVRVFIFFVKI